MGFLSHPKLSCFLKGKIKSTSINLGLTNLGRDSHTNKESRLKIRHLGVSDTAKKFGTEQTRFT